MSQHSSTDSEDWEPMQSPYNEGKDSEGTPLNNSDLDAIQTRIACWRRLWNEAHGVRNDLKRRDRGDNDAIEKFPGKRIDIKYDEVDQLTFEILLSGLDRLEGRLRACLAGAPWKYQRDNFKIIKAVSKMDKACRARWNGYSPVDFDAYLSSIERELPEVPDSDVVKQIKISGLQTLPNTRTGMVALAQRVWESIRLKRNTPVSEVKNTGSSTLQGQTQRPRPWNKLYNSRPGRQSSRDLNKFGGNNDSENYKAVKSEGHKEKSSKIEKQEPTCYSCGELGHIKPKPRIQQQ
ncbi:hypothetical protein V1508DRAFT_406733 [Lipomyces doorenjongii]|uniref:uncharacterized protein n=1 Tax=Lipomyces doorenjongii TaxID=383834 RepID=UPI0034D01BCA